MMPSRGRSGGVRGGGEGVGGAGGRRAAGWCVGCWPLALPMLLSAYIVVTAALRFPRVGAYIVVILRFPRGASSYPYLAAALELPRRCSSLSSRCFAVSPPRRCSWAPLRCFPVSQPRSPYARLQRRRGSWDHKATGTRPAQVKPIRTKTEPAPPMQGPVASWSLALQQ